MHKGKNRKKSLSSTFYPNTLELHYTNIPQAIVYRNAPNLCAYHRTSPDISQNGCCDRGYARPSGRPRVSDPATYRSGTPRNQHPAVARWHGLLHGLATQIHEISGLVLGGLAKVY
jgi:hypothetical protein